MRGVAVVTGGAGGMGLATAKVLGRDHLVVVSDVSEGGLERASADLRSEGIECEAVACDVTDVAAVEQLVTQARSAGEVVAVVHTAGISPKMGDPRRIIGINSLGTVNINEAFGRVAGRSFSMVNVASSAGHLPPGFPTPRRSYPLALTDPARFVERMVKRCNRAPARMRSGLAYSISKHFVIWYSRSQTAALGAKGGRIVSVSPGSFDTEMGRLEDASGAGALAQRSALGRYGTVDEIAAVLAFCASDQPGYLTGTDLLVDGGASATMGVRDMIALGRELGAGRRGGSPDVDST